MQQQKYYISRFLNDCNIYKNFNYFHIPKKVTSTGRFYSKPNILQLQGDKMARGFVTFQPQPIFTEGQFPQVFNIISQETGIYRK